MKKFAVLTIVLIAIATSGCGPSPEELTAQFLDAINSQDIDSALELISEDATLQVDGTLSLNGKAEIEDWLATQADLSHRMEGDPTASGSGVAIESCSISSHQWLYFGVNPMSGTCIVELEGALITSFAVQFDENSKARLSESVAPVSADLVGIWTATGGALPGTNDPIPVFLQFFEDGSSRWAISPEDLLIAPDSDHPGVRLTWTYEDYVLTLQNQGPASEGFCQEQDVGTYLVRNTEAGGIQFKKLEEPCAWRTLLSYVPDFDPYVP